MALPQQFVKIWTQATFGALAHELQLSAQELGSKTWHQPLGQLPQISPTLRQVLPFIRRKEPKYRRTLRHGFAMAEIEQCNDGS